MRFHFARAYHWQALRLVLACGLAEAVSLGVGMSEIYWALITAVVVTRPVQSESKDKGWDRVIGSLIGAAAGFGVLELTRLGLPKGPIFCVAFLLLAYVVSVWPNLRLSAITLIVVALVPSSESPVIRPLDRVIEIVIGSLAGWAVSAVLDSDRLRRFLPEKAPEREIPSA